MNGWIKSSEHLPPPLGEDKKHVYYIVTKALYEGNETGLCAWWNGWNRHCGDDRKNEVGNDFIVAWMPLPEPWKEEEDECI